MEYLYAQQWLEAIGPIETAVTLGPYHVEGWNNLGKAYLELGQWRDAEEALLKGIEINRVSPSRSVRMCWNNVGLVYLRLAQEAKLPADKRFWLEKAETHLAKAIKLDPLYETAYANQAQAAFDLMELARTLEERRRQAQVVIEAVQKERQVAHMRGYEIRLAEHRRLVFALLELDEGDAALKHLLSLQPMYASGELKLAWLDLLGELALTADTPQYEGGPKAKGYEHLMSEACRRIDAALQGPGGARLAITRARLADAMGEPQLALRLYQAGIKADPANPYVKKARERVAKLSAPK
jgi:tetratricopeptide (TPR) repeat protein